MALSPITDQKFRTLRLRGDGPVLVLTIDHPDNDKNLFDVELMEELGAVMAALRGEREFRAVLFTGSGGYFSAGGNFSLMKALGEVHTADYVGRLGRRLVGDMLDVPLPIVCAMNGPALGFGCSMVLLSDVVFAPSDTFLSDPHVKRGIATPDGAAVWTMALGPMRAKRFLLTGEKLSAAEAADLGLITFVCEPGETVARAQQFAHELAASAPSAIAHTKLLCNKHVRAGLEMSFDIGTAWEAADFSTADHREAIAAFRDNRPPTFTGR